MPCIAAQVASIAHTGQQQQQQLSLTEVQLKALLDASAAQAAAATAAAVSEATPAAPAPAARMKTPLQVYAALAADGVKRCTEIPLGKLLLLSVYAGVYVSFGGFVAPLWCLSCQVGANCRPFH
jgi:hypothetical protein